MVSMESWLIQYRETRGLRMDNQIQIARDASLDTRKDLSPHLNDRAIIEAPAK